MPDYDKNINLYLTSIPDEEVMSQKHFKRQGNVDYKLKEEMF